MSNNTKDVVSCLLFFNDEVNKYSKINTYTIKYGTPLCCISLALSSLLSPILILSELSLIYMCHHKSSAIYNKVENLLLNSEIIQEYNKTVTECSNLFFKLNICNPIEIYAAFTYLLSNGYLSDNHHFYLSHYVNDILNKGLNIIDGSSSCRHITYFLSDLYKKMNIESYNLNVRINNNLPKSNEAIEINYEDELAHLFKNNLNFSNLNGCPTFKQTPNRKANHSIMAVNDSLKSYFIDPTHCLLLYPIIEENKLSIIDDNNNCSSYHIEFNKDYIDNKSTRKSILKMMKKEIVSYKEYKENWNRALYICKDNYKLLENFYDTNKDRYSYISKEIKQYNKLLSFL